jgi:hypothetical protein
MALVEQHGGGEELRRLGTGAARLPRAAPEPEQEGRQPELEVEEPEVGDMVEPEHAGEDRRGRIPVPGTREELEGERPRAGGHRHRRGTGDARPDQPAEPEQDVGEAIRARPGDRQRRIRRGPCPQKEPDLRHLLRQVVDRRDPHHRERQREERRRESRPGERPGRRRPGLRSGCGAA